MAKKANATSFKPGQSGNPGGRPKGVAEVQELARKHTPQALKTLLSICENEDAPPPARVSAAVALLDRAWGKPAQPTEISGKDGGPVEVNNVRDRIAGRLARLTPC